MGQSLAVGSLLHDRYRVKKVLSLSDEQGATYIVRDETGRRVDYAVNEIVPPDGLGEETLRSRHELFRETIESLRLFEHPALPRIVDSFRVGDREYLVIERFEGLTLRDVLAMSLTELPEKQVLTWALQICDAIIYAHDRPKPFTFHSLDLGSLVLTSDESVKLMDYGLARIFATGPDLPVETLAAKERFGEFARFGRALYTLLARDSTDEVAVERTFERAGAMCELVPNHHVNPHTARVVNRLLRGEAQKSYVTFHDVRKDLEVALAPPAADTWESPQPGDTPVPAPQGGDDILSLTPAWVRGLERATNAVLRRGPVGKALLLAGVLLLLVGLTWLNHTGPGYVKHGPVAYLVSGADLLTLSLSTHHVVDRKHLGFQARDVAVAGGQLFVSDPDHSRLVRFKTSNNRAPSRYPFVQVDRDPTRVVADEKGQYLYVAHPLTHNVTRINLAFAVPQMDEVLVVRDGPRDLLPSHDGGRLFVSDQEGDRISILDPLTRQPVADVPMPGRAHGLAESPAVSQADQLWVCCQTPDAIAVVDVPSHHVTATIPSSGLMGGRRPSSVAFSADGSRAYVAMSGSHQIVEFNAHTFTAVRSITTTVAPRILRSLSDCSSVWIGGPQGAEVLATSGRGSNASPEPTLSAGAVSGVAFDLSR